MKSKISSPQLSVHQRMNRSIEAKTSATDSRHGGKRAPLPTAAEFIGQMANSVARLQASAGPDWVVSYPMINPAKICEEAKESPMSAACRCQVGCTMLGLGQQRRLRDMLMAAYQVALCFEGRESQIESLAFAIEDGRTKNALKSDVVKADLLHYLFLYIFFQSGFVTRDRATQYAQALKPFYVQRKPVEDVAQLMAKYGPDKLRKAAQAQQAAAMGALALQQQGVDPETISIEELLEAEERKDEESSEIEDPNDVFDRLYDGSREIPPDGSGDEDEVGVEGENDLLDDEDLETPIDSSTSESATMLSKRDSEGVKLLTRLFLLVHEASLSEIERKKFMVLLGDQFIWLAKKIVEG